MGIKVFNLFIHLQRIKFLNIPRIKHQRSKNLIQYNIYNNCNEGVTLFNKFPQLMIENDD